MNPFRVRIESGELTTLEELKALYRAEVKRLHPDLSGEAAPGVDFDRLKQEYHEAYRLLLEQDDAEDPAPEPPGGIASSHHFLHEFRDLVARGFPVNVQAAAKNRAYAASIRRVSAYLNHHFEDDEFFARVNGETRSLKRTDAKTHWYVMQIYWNIGDWQVTRYDYYRRIYVRHLAFIRETLIAAGSLTLLRMLEFLVAETSAVRT